MKALLTALLATFIAAGGSVAQASTGAPGAAAAGAAGAAATPSSSDGGAADQQQAVISIPAFGPGPVVRPAGTPPSVVSGSDAKDCPPGTVKKDNGCTGPAQEPKNAGTEAAK